MTQRKPEPAIERLVASLQPLGPVRSRAMFGGHGLFLDDRMFALVAYERVYFKVDGESEPAFRDAGGEPFVYDGKGKPMRMSYWTVPFEPAADMQRWLEFAELGVAASRRAARPKRRPRR